MIAVAVCTYNPDERLLARTLDAIASQKSPPGGIECVIVDNCSSPPVSTLPIVRAFLRRCSWARVVLQPKQGLTNARLSAIEHTTAECLCFIDDDNEPASDYLLTALKIFAEFACVGVVGAGRIEVDFVDPASEGFAQRFSHHFQENDFDGFAYGCVSGTWTEYYPPGSCMVVRREVLNKFRSAFLVGQISASDRVGSSLSSGGDTQIVWEAVKMGFAAGTSSGLRLKHMIPAKRISLAYIKRLCYGTSSSYLPALVDSFPSERSKLPKPPSTARIAWTMVKMTGSHVLRNKIGLLPIELATYVGRIDGLMRAGGTQNRLIERSIRFLGLQ